MKSDNNNIEDDDLITYSIDGVNYKFKSNPAMLDIFKSIIETLPLQKYLDNERSKRNIEPQQPSTGSIWNFKPTSPTHPVGFVCFGYQPSPPPSGGYLMVQNGVFPPSIPLLLNIDGCSTHTPAMLFWLLELIYFWVIKQLYICFVWFIKFQPFQYDFEKNTGENLI